MKKSSVLALTMLGVLGVTSLTGCDDTIDADPSYIEIVDGSISDTYYVNEEVDYSGLKVAVYNDDDKEIMTVSYSGNEEDFVLGTIDTSSTGSGTFTVQYTYTNEEGTSWTLDTSLTYTVYDEANPDSMILISWEENETYTSYLAAKNAANLANDGELLLDDNNFIDNSGKFYVGNENAVDLMPTLMGYSFAGNFAVASSLPEEDIEITITDSEGNEKDLSTYMSDDAQQNAKTYGQIKFLSDLDENVDREITLTFSLEGEEYEDFQDISYEITIVDGGYNITNAKELVLIDNSKNDDSYVAMKEEALGLDEGALADTPYYTYDSFIIFNNLTIELEDIPSYALYSEDDNPNDEEVIGTLKDWIYVYEREYANLYSEEKADNLTIYGNYNEVSLGSTFPWVISTNARGTLPTGSTNAINTHTALIGGSERDAKPSEYEIIIKDLHVMGNQGVSSNQMMTITKADGSTYTGYCGGVLFSKSAYDMTYDNLVLNNFFTIHVHNGFGTYATGASIDFEQVEITINRSRLTDCFSAMIFNYGDGKVTFNESIASNAGGFIVINQANAYNTTVSSRGWSNLTDEDKAKLQGSDVIIDNDSIMENYVTGEGGWFDIYGVSSVLAGLKIMIDQNLHQYGKQLFFKDDTSREVFNAIVLTMNSEMESAGTLESGMSAEVTIGDENYTNYGEGKDEVNNALYNYAVSGDVSSLQNLLSAMTSTSYGANFFTEYTLALLYAYDSDGNAQYISPYTNDPSDTSSIKFYTLSSLATSLLGYGNMEEIGSSDLSSNYVALNYNYGGSMGAPSNLISDLQSYSGETTYSLVLGLYDYEA